MKLKEAIEMVTKRLQVDVKDELFDWTTKQVLNCRFSSRRHVVEYAIQQLMAIEDDLPQIIHDDSMK